MHIIKLQIHDTVLEKILSFLKQLPQEKIVILENSTKDDEQNDFIAHYTKNPINTDFLTREEVYEK